MAVFMLAVGAAVLGFVLLRVVAGVPDARARFDRLSTEQIIVRMQRAMADAGSYHVEVVGTDLVLSGWGGMNSGAVWVQLDGQAAIASVQRTGDLNYTIVTVNGQTYFERSTCQSFSRLAGGGDVLAPFFLRELTGSERRTVPIGVVGDPAFIDATTPEFGHVVIELDPRSFLPLRLSRSGGQPDGDGTSEWEFSRWGEGNPIDMPAVDAQEREPGGDPC